MHQLYFVALPKEEGVDTPDMAMSEATELLDINNFCSSDGGYFSSSKGDWYEVGGRWSDFLVEKHAWAIEAEKEIKAYLNRPENLQKPKKKGDKPEVYSIRGASYGDDADKKKQAELRERVELIWGKHRPPEYPKVPYDRWYSEDGLFREHLQKRADCAELITQETIDYIKKKEAEYKKSSFGSDGLEVFVKDHDGLTDEWKILDWFEKVGEQEIIGKYWLIVIDYHS